MNVCDTELLRGPLTYDYVCIGCGKKGHTNRGVSRVEKEADMARRSRRLIWLWVLLAIVAAMGFVGVSAGISASNIMKKIEQANRASERLEGEFSRFDMQAAATSIEEMATIWSEVDKEAHEWEWQIVRVVPVVGEDVGCLQRTARIADELTNDGLTPVMVSLRALSEGMDANMFEVITGKVTQLGDLLGALRDASDVVSECRRKADALPEANFEQTNQAMEDLRSQLADIERVFSSFDTLLGAIDIAGQFVGV